MSNKIKRLDLSKITPEELPTKDVEITLKDGTKQTVTIHPLTGRGRIAWGGNPRHSYDSVQFQEHAMAAALVYGADLSEDEALRFMNDDYVAARNLGTAIWILHTDFLQVQQNERENAEKNSQTAEPSSNMPVSSGSADK